ncbi:MAG: signal recognition particle-docking protein FtsY [Planctomycetes bacterium]|nr:signal recognition particle-docking protein FtsY [Planctomycetota bacterium]
MPRDLAPGREPVDRVALESQDLGYFVDGVALAQILDRTGCSSQRTASNCFVRVRFTIKELFGHKDPAALLSVLREKLVHTLEQGDHTLTWDSGNGPHVTLVAGVNGSGKTPTIGKLASRLKSEGKSVLLGTADTFRAAAVEQLIAWSEKVDVPIVKHQEGADPASVAFDAADAAIARGIDCLIIDTAGRLHTKTNLMEELSKLYRVIQRKEPTAPHEVLLVLDATIGQNALIQAEAFTKAAEVTSVCLTKLDGTSKGGIVFAIADQMGIPVRLVGTGEEPEDLAPFSAEAFVEALFR